MFKPRSFRFHLIPLGMMILMSFWGQVLSSPSTAQNSQHPLSPVFEEEEEEFEPDNNGSPDDSTGAGGR